LVNIERLFFHLNVNVESRLFNSDVVVNKRTGFVNTAARVFRFRLTHVAVGHKRAEQRAVKIGVSSFVINKIRQAWDLVDVAASVLVDLLCVASVIVNAVGRNAHARLAAEIDAVKF